ncbi:hypothetical protein SAMN05216446_0801 [Parafannyhessea umbonata]|uniref:Uncharacterized protein n=1 Tax=Parafannyhessea umbonata TaxID=604330 RepID=A0A1H9P3Z6_9ACTN|nr:hypothetical protein SAMN05216446_0801 [Parafannyhessea umbonata]
MGTCEDCIFWKKHHTIEITSNGCCIWHFIQNENSVPEGYEFGSKGNSCSHYVFDDGSHAHSPRCFDCTNWEGDRSTILVDCGCGCWSSVEALLERIDSLDKLLQHHTFSGNSLANEENEVCPLFKYAD